MEAVTDGMFLTKEDENRFNDWTKEEIYKAYLLEVEAKVRLNEVVKRQEREIASLKHDIANMV